MDTYLLIAAIIFVIALVLGVVIAKKEATYVEAEDVFVYVLASTIMSILWAGVIPVVVFVLGGLYFVDLLVTWLNKGKG